MTDRLQKQFAEVTKEPRKMSEHDPDSVLGGMTDGLLTLMKENQALKTQRDALASALSDRVELWDGPLGKSILMPGGSWLHEGQIGYAEALTYCDQPATV